MNTAAVGTPTSPPPVISATAVSKSWGDHRVFSNLTAAVPSGVTGLLGSNGSGKTTLFGMLLGLHHPDGGSLSVMGEDPSNAGPELRQRIGYSPEHHDLPNDVAAQDFVRHIAQVHGLPTREATTRSSDALWLVGLGEERARPIGTMSTGQRQRVKLAQAIAHSPDLILLDEPTDGLDPVQRDDMLELIRRVGTEYGIDVVLSSHLLEEVERIADNVVIIADGSVAAAGAIDELQTGRGGLIVVVAGRQTELVAALQATGLDVRDDGSRLIVGVDHEADELADTVRDAIASVGAPLRRISPMQNSLEDIFLAEVHGT
jgi:ABC-2 type transport system ATP-binding protein